MCYNSKTKYTVVTWTIKFLTVLKMIIKHLWVSFLILDNFRYPLRQLYFIRVIKLYLNNASSNVIYLQLQLIHNDWISQALNLDTIRSLYYLKSFLLRTIKPVWDRALSVML